MRALQKAAPLLEQVKYYTGNDKEDETTRHAVHNFLGIIKLVFQCLIVWLFTLYMLIFLQEIPTTI